MIRLNNAQVTVWTSNQFTYPALTGTNSTLLYFNHNLGVPIHQVTMSAELSDTNQPIIYNLDRNTSAGATYGYRCDGDQDLNTLTVRVYRVYGSAVSARARLFSYGL